MPFGIKENEGRGLIDIWCSKKNTKRYKKIVNFCLDFFTVGGCAALGAIAYESAKDEVCSYGARSICRGACVLVLTPATAASVGSVMMACSTAKNAGRVYSTGSFLWNVGITTLKSVAQGATLPQQGISLLLCGEPYTPLVHDQSLLNRTNVTAISEGFKEGLTLVNATALKEAAKTVAKESMNKAINEL